MKRILILFVDLGTKGGMQRYNRDLCHALEDEFDDIEYTVLSLYGPGKEEFKNRQNTKTKFYDKAGPKPFQKIWYIFDMALAIIKKRHDFLICGHVNLSPVGFFQKKLFKLKYAVLTYGLDCWGIKSGIKYNALKAADMIITISEYSKKKMVENGIREDRIKILNPAVDTSLFYRKKADRRLIKRLGTENKLILLTVARLAKGRHKGHDVMLRVLKELGEGCVWLVIGGGDDLPRLRQKAEARGLLKKTVFLGEVADEELADYYNLCDVFVMPSKDEGFGIVFIEAMACGKPVVAGDGDGANEPLMAGKLGFLVNPDKTEEIKNAVKRASCVKENRTDPDYLRREVEANFGKEVFKKRVKEVFSEVLQ